MGDLNITDAPTFLDRAGVRLACRYRTGAGPAILFLPGYGSDMTGGKAVALDAWCGRIGRAMLRFDYAGTGESDGVFELGTLAGWRDDALAVLDATEGDVVLVGSSMGGWLMLLVALARPDRVRGLIGIAAAPDFSDWGFSRDEKMTILQLGQIVRRSEYGSQITTRAFWQSAEALRLTHAPIAIDCPVRLLHGEADTVVPPWVATRLAGLVRSADVQTTFVKDGDHRLSRPQDIALLIRTVDALMEIL
ncbi:MAG TPA: alpha/beta hydrolase [Sphingomonas sp.]